MLECSNHLMLLSLLKLSSSFICHLCRLFSLCQFFDNVSRYFCLYDDDFYIQEIMSESLYLILPPTIVLDEDCRILFLIKIEIKIIWAYIQNNFSSHSHTG
jgi:hypothetical protein